MRTTFGGRSAAADASANARTAMRVNIRTMIALRGGCHCAAPGRAGQTGTGGTRPATGLGWFRPGGQSMADRISPQEARRHLQADPNALLVCAYDSDEKFRQNRLDGAISLADFQARERSLPKDREIIFYCA